MHRPAATPWPWLALLLVAASLLALRAAPQGWIERVWAGVWVPHATTVTAALSDRSPIPLAALWLGLLLAGWLTLLWRLRRRSLADRLGWGLLPLALAVLLFDASFAIAYRRAPLEQRIGLPSAAAGPDLWWSLGVALRAEVERQAQFPLPSVARSAPWWDGALATAGGCVAELEQQLSGRAQPLAVPTRVRRLPAGSLLAGGFAGITDPLTHEVYVDAGLDPVGALAVALHEYGHAVLAAHEAEAELIGLLAAWRCHDPAVVFAGTLSALTQVSREGLQRFGASELWAARFRGLVADPPEVVRLAWSAAREAAAAHRSESLTRLAVSGYDRYLRSQGIDHGMADYGRGITLLVGVWWQCQQGPDGAAELPGWCPPLPPEVAREPALAYPPMVYRVEASAAPPQGERGRYGRNHGSNDHRN